MRIFPLMSFLILFGGAEAFANPLSQSDLKALLGSNWTSDVEFWTSDFSKLTVTDLAENSKCEIVFGAVQNALLETASLDVNHEALRLTAEGVRLGCEAARLIAVSNRLAASAASLRARADKLDESFWAANSVAPQKYPDAVGRDRSQKRMRLDALNSERSIEKIQIDINKLRGESQAKLQLALKVDPQLVVAYDAKAQLDLLRRLLGEDQKLASLLKWVFAI